DRDLWRGHRRAELGGAERRLWLRRERRAACVRVAPKSPHPFFGVLPLGRTTGTSCVFSARVEGGLGPGVSGPLSGCPSSLICTWLGGLSVDIDDTGLSSKPCGLRTTPLFAGGVAGAGLGGEWVDGGTLGGTTERPTEAARVARRSARSSIRRIH